MPTKEDKYTDKEGNSVSLKELLKGKTVNQQTSLKFFMGLPIKEGCMKKEYLDDNGYMAIVSGQVPSDLKIRALRKLGIDEDQVKEIDPVCFEGFKFEYKHLAPYTQVVGNRFVSSMYEVTWLFFGDEQVYVYNYAFDTTDTTQSDRTLEYFYRDITAFATASDNYQRKVWTVKKGGVRESEMRNVNAEEFKIVVPGEAFECAYRDKDGASQKVAAMKQKLREKKQK